jgi:lipoprotein-releasing system ATP-binding protein
MPDSMVVAPERGVIEAAGLTKTYVGGDGGLITVLDRLDVSVRRAEMVAVVGASGAGKSTLLHLLGLLDRPSAGEIRVNGESVLRRSDESLSVLRNRTVGFVFQFHHLLREFSATENVMMPMRIGGVSPGDARGRAEALLERVGLGSRREHRPSELSGGEQQRVAVARALAMEPLVLLADEPSGNLDHATAERLHDLLAELTRDLRIGMVVVTHNRSLAARADRILVLEDAHLTERAVGEAVA